MEKIKKYVKGLKIGDVQKHKNVAIAPLIGKDSKLDYLTLEEALGSGLEVSEISNAGAVPFLNFTNKTGKEILILQGEYLEGGKQNRMVKNNIYIAKDFDGKVPVNCVEHGRWHSGPVDIPRGPRLPGRPISPAFFRSTGKRATSGVICASLRSQQEVWDEVDEITTSCRVRSATRNLGDVYKGRQEDISDYMKNFKYESGSVGIAVVVNGNDMKSYGVDIFDQGSTMEKNFNKLAESYILEAITGGQDIKRQTKKEISDFLSKIDECGYQERQAISLGRDLVLQGNSVEGFALENDGIQLYTTFRSRKGQGPGNTGGTIRMQQNPYRTGFIRR